MARRTPLTAAEIDELLAGLPGWTLAGGRLHRHLRFRDFYEAWGFMCAAALHAQQLDHHPEWRNVYGEVVVDLVTHDAGGVTAMDAELARRMESLARRWPAA